MSFLLRIITREIQNGIEVEIKDCYISLFIIHCLTCFLRLRISETIRISLHSDSVTCAAETLTSISQRDEPQSYRPEYARLRRRLLGG